MSLRERKKAATREAIVVAARALFAEHGYEGTTTRSIAARAGIATGTLFNYAPTKEAVVVLVWEHAVARAVEEGFAATTGEDPIDDLCALFRPIFAVYASDPALGRVFLQSVMFSTDPALQQVTEGFLARVAVHLGPHDDNAMLTEMNVFGAYYLALTAFLAGRLTSVTQLDQAFRALLLNQGTGWLRG